MSKDIKEFMNLLDRGDFADQQRDLVERYRKEDPSINTGAMEFAREIAKLTVKQYHEWCESED